MTTPTTSTSTSATNEDASHSHHRTKQRRADDANTVFVRFVPPSTAVTRQHLVSYFSDIGPVKKCSVIRDTKPKKKKRRHDEDAQDDGEGGATGGSGGGGREGKGYGFVKFVHPDDAHTAASQWSGRTMTIPDDQSTYVVYVESATLENKEKSIKQKAKREESKEKEGRGKKEKQTKKKQKQRRRLEEDDDEHLAAATRVGEEEAREEAEAARRMEDEDEAQQRQQQHLLELASKRKRTSRVILRNLSFRAGSQHVKSIMEERFGKVAEVTLPLVPGLGDENEQDDDERQHGTKKKKKNKKVPQHRGFAFVTFDDAASARKAVEHGDAISIKGRPVAIDFSVSKAVHKRMRQEEKEEEEEQEEEQQQQQQERQEEAKEKEGEAAEEDELEEEEGGESGSDSDEESSSSGDGDDNVDEEAAEKEEEDATEHSSDRHHKYETEPDPDVASGKTIFCRNLPFDAVRHDLFNLFKPYGRLTGVFLVKDKITGMGKGTAFVHFQSSEGCHRALEASQADDDAAFVSGKNSAAGGGGGDEGAFGGLYLRGRRILVDKAVDRSTASALRVERDADGQPLERAKRTGKDRRNLYLKDEGRVADRSGEGGGSGGGGGASAAGGGAWEDLPESDRDKRGRAHKDKATKLRSPLFFVNPCRLSVRNLAKHVTEKELRQLASRGIRAGLDAGLVTTDDVVAHWRAGGDMSSRDVVRKLAEAEEAVDANDDDDDDDKAVIPPFHEKDLKRYVPSVYIDRDYGAPASSVGGGGARRRSKGGELPPSRGFGFVEFTHHAHALACLRELNNNPAYSVEYVTGGKRAVEMKKRLTSGGGRGKKKKNRKGRSGGEGEGEGGDGDGGVDFVGEDGRVRVPRLIVEFTVENKAKAKKQSERRTQQSANAEKQRQSKKEKQAKSGEGKPENIKKSRGALQREKKRKRKEKEGEMGSDAAGDLDAGREMMRRKHEVLHNTKNDEVQPKKAIKPRKKRKVDKEEAAEEAAFENMVKSYKAAFTGVKGKPSKDKDAEQIKNPREEVGKRRWFE